MKNEKKFDDIQVGNYVEKYYKKYFKIEEIINNGEEIKIKISNKTDIETVEKHYIYGIELLPKHMIKMDFKESIEYCRLIGGNKPYYGFKIFEKDVVTELLLTKIKLLWVNLPNVDLFENDGESEPKNTAYLICEKSILKNGLDWNQIDTYKEEKKLIPMRFLHTLQNYINDELDLHYFDFSYVLH